MLLVVLSTLFLGALAYPQVNISCKDSFVSPGATAHTSCSVQHGKDDGVSAVYCHHWDETNRIQIGHMTSQMKNISESHEGIDRYLPIPNVLIRCYV